MVLLRDFNDISIKLFAVLIIAIPIPEDVKLMRQGWGKITY